MPGLAGVVARGRPLANQEQIVSTVRDVYGVNGITYVEKSYRSDHAIVSNTLTGLLSGASLQPARSQSGDRALFLEGEVFNCDELAGSFGLDAESPCAVLLGLYERLGEGFLCRLNGEFNIVIYDMNLRRISIASDHLASMPMYFTEADERFVFGSEKKAVLALLDTAPEIDPLGLLQVVAHRHNLDERTFLRGIRRMMPGTRVSYQGTGLAVERYQRLEFNVPADLPGADELVDEGMEHLRTATERRIRGKHRLLISLSAGLDSRAVACAIGRDVRPIHSRTRGGSDSLEASLAAGIAGALGFDHFREDPGARPYSEIIPKIAWRTECEVHFANGISLANHRMLKERADFIIGGWLGDVSSGRHISPYFLRPAGRSEFLQRAWSRYLVYSRQRLASIFTREFLDDTFPGLWEAFVTSFDELPAGSNIQAFELWDLYQRQRRMTTSSMPVDSYAFEKIRPFYDKDYLAFSLKLPTRLRFGQTLYQAIIYRLGPEIRHIPNANSQLKVHRSIVRNLLNEVLVDSLKTARKLADKVLPARVSNIRHGLADNLASGTRRDPGFRMLIQDFIHSVDFNAGIFDRKGIQNMLDEHYGGQADRAYELGYVATLAAGLPYFLKKTTRCPREAEPLA